MGSKYAAFCKALGPTLLYDSIRATALRLERRLTRSFARAEGSLRSRSMSSYP